MFASKFSFEDPTHFTLSKLCSVFKGLPIVFSVSIAYQPRQLN
ncbi:Hypothetical protein ADU70_1665 [Pediococcus damnosus]|uniref:Uncharacterized protein n=1 Tax=Pediococcus damnosus TaxID=51663 RepID=A0AAC9B3A7_9LACO|nr:Hypothetical protein ADU70_1665 [Pediococcus damnosus]